MDDLLKTAVGLLHYCPSTDRCDLPKGIPNWYLRDVDKYHDRGRKAAIKLRDAADRIEQLESQLADWSKAPEWANWFIINKKGNGFWTEDMRFRYLGIHEAAIGEET